MRIVSLFYIFVNLCDLIEIISAYALFYFLCQPDWEKDCLINIISGCACERFWGTLTFELLDWELVGTVHSGGNLNRMKMQEKDKFVLFA